MENRNKSGMMEICKNLNTVANKKKKRLEWIKHAVKMDQ
jgi:hypothetical protein